MTAVELKCDLCGNPTDGYVCRRCSGETAGYLKSAIDLAGEVETTVARLARYATRGGRHVVLDEDEDRGPSSVNQRQPVHSFGWPASKDRTAKGALRSGPLPVDLNASARAAVAFNHVTTWARLVDEERGTLAFDPMAQPLCGPWSCDHDSCQTIRFEAAGHPAAVAAAYLLRQLDWVRHQQFADEANEQLRAAGAVIKRIVDSPPAREIVGQCDCGAYLYAFEGAATVNCEACPLSWDVASSRQTLREELRGYLMTAAEAAALLALFGLTGDRNRCRKTIVMWAQRGRIQVHGEVDGSPAYLFGEVLDRATREVSGYVEERAVSA